jgi:hypothetical protein
MNYRDNYINKEDVNKVLDSWIKRSELIWKEELDYFSSALEVMNDKEMLSFTSAYLAALRVVEAFQYSLKAVLTGNNLVETLQSTLLNWKRHFEDAPISLSAEFINTVIKHSESPRFKSLFKEVERSLISPQGTLKEDFFKALLHTSSLLFDRFLNSGFFDFVLSNALYNVSWEPDPQESLVQASFTTDDPYVSEWSYAPEWMSEVEFKKAVEHSRTILNQIKDIFESEDKGVDFFRMSELNHIRDKMRSVQEYLIFTERKHFLQLPTNVREIDWEQYPIWTIAAYVQGKWNIGKTGIRTSLPFLFDFEVLLPLPRSIVYAAVHHRI